MVAEAQVEHMDYTSLQITVKEPKVLRAEVSHIILSSIIIC